jgi:hypothetical protein
LTLGANVELVPTAQVDVSGGVVEELARPHGTVTGFLEAALEGTNLRMIDEVEGGIVATCGGSELARENGSS